MVSTDRTAATDEALAEPIEYSGVIYTTDSAEYRAAKFRAEAGDKFALQSLLYHYLFTERHCMTDNRAKNTFCSYEPCADGVYRWNFNKDYDNDTAEGNDNIGGLTFTYGLEDTDMVGESYVFNASDSVLWTNVRDLLSAELQAMFLDRESAGAWSKDRFLKKVADYQAVRPEALVAEDMWGKYYSAYLSGGNASYLAKMLGTKTDQRRQFETYQEGYMSSKYKGSVATTDMINLRSNAQVFGEGDIPDIVPYADMYIRVKYGTAGEYVVRAKKGVAYDAICPTSTLNDVETNIYLGSNIASVGSFASAKPKYVNAAGARKLRQIVIGSGTDGYSNTGFDITSTAFEGDTFIERIDLRNLSNSDEAKVKDLDLTRLASLEEIYLTGSKIVTGVTFAQRAPVRIAHLNALRMLSARELSVLEKFTMDASNLQRLRVENCSPVLDTLGIVCSAPNLSRIRLIGVDWTLADGSLLLRLAELAGLDGNGRDIDTPVIRGKCHVASMLDSEAERVRAAFPGLELTYNIPVYTVRFLTPGGAVIKTQQVVHGQSAKAPAEYTPDSGFTVYTVAFSGYTNVVMDLDITASTYKIKKKYLVRNGVLRSGTSTFKFHTGSFAKSGNYLVYTGSLSADSYCNLGFVPGVDLSGGSKAVFEGYYKATSGSRNVYFVIEPYNYSSASEPTSSWPNSIDDVPGYKAISAGAADAVFSIDVSSQTVSRNIGFFVAAATGAFNFSVYMKNVYIES